MSQSDPIVPYGLCQCGCGQRTKISPKTSTGKGWVRGEPRRFVRGHHLRVPSYQALVFTGQRNSKIAAAHADGRIPPPQEQTPGPGHFNWRGENVSYAQAHIRVRMSKGSPTEYACVLCSRSAQEWGVNHAHPSVAYGSHAGRIKAYSLDPAAYHALCRPCHRKADGNGGLRCQTHL